MIIIIIFFLKKQMSKCDLLIVMGDLAEAQCGACYQNLVHVLVHTPPGNELVIAFITWIAILLRRNIPGNLPLTFTVRPSEFVCTQLEAIPPAAVRDALKCENFQEAHNLALRPAHIKQEIVPLRNDYTPVNKRAGAIKT